GVRLHNPLGIVPDSVIERFFSGPWSIMLLTTVACCVAAVFVRYRRAAAQERAQIKWFLYACALFLIIYPIGSFVSSNDCWSIVFDLMVLTIPTSIGIAILRYRLYDIDIIIRRTLVYSTLTLTLGLVYLGCIVVSRTLIAPYIGGSDVAIVASTLAIAALFTPLRRRIQNIIDKRFYRRKYDAAKVLAAFGATARDETDLERLTAELLRVVDATMQPESVGLWLREPSTTAGGAPPQSGNTIGARFEHTTRSSLIERSDENETMKSSLPLRHAQEPAGPAKVSTPIGQILFDRSISRYLPWSLPSILLAGAVLVPLALWLLYADLGSRFGQPAAALKSLANLCALTGTAAFAVSVILGARLKLVERALGGADQLYRAHRRIGAATPLLLAGHALFVVASKAIASLPAGLLLFTPLAGWDVFLGVIAFAGLVAALLFPRLRTLKHEAFVLLHRALGVAFLVGGLHVLLVPATWALASPLIAYLLALLAAGALAFVYRSALGRFLIRRHRYQIAEVNRLGESAVELVLAPAGATMPFLPGQFAFLTILDERLPREAHPFSITSAPSDPRVRMVVKALGDYTTRLLDLRPGGAALLEGPYGGCSYRRVANRRQIWIAGGVGVTPFLSMARSLGGTPYDIDFYYCTERTEDAFFLDELFVLSDQTPQLRIIPIRKISLGHITVDDLQAASGDLPRYDILLCGPPVMMRNLRAQLQARGVPPAQIHFEDFAAMAV
ncbi:MAG TPA: ferredoxin reductase family protein, partial [Roseiflexaceae bacterium]|nr:ferredoxin reductase family protein [Roseiflexaceae bacterium]